MEDLRAPADPQRPVRLLELDGLVRLRWMVLLAQAGLGALYVASDPAAWSTLPLVGAILTGLASNAALQWARPADTDAVRTGVVVLDGLLFTALFAVSGGATNPFALSYLLHVAIAAMALTPRASWTVALLDGLAYAALFLVPDDDNPHAAHMRGHLLGMWLAYAVSAPFVNVLVARVRTTLADADRRVAEAARLRQRTEKLTSLATLAAGAAHELGTPLSTIAVVARELERSADAATADDARLVRAEIERCRAILLQLSGDAGAGTGEAPRSVTLAQLVEQALASRPGVAVTLPAAADRHVASLPVGLVGQALRRLVDNARDADPTGDIAVTARVEGERLELAVRDHGPAMPPEVLQRAGEPFFTTKAPGKGMGLGLFFARSIAVQLGGELVLESEAGRGTTARLSLPMRLA